MKAIVYVLIWQQRDIDILFLKVKKEIIREHGSFAGTTQCLFQNNKTLARFFACDKIR